MLNAIKEIIEIEPDKQRITLRFANDEIKRIDLSKKLKEWSTSSTSPFSNLLVPSNFMKVRIDSEFDTLTWGNDIDLCPDMLYELGEKVTKKDVV